MIKINMPLGAKFIIDMLINNGYNAYIVGGCVRDSLLNKAPSDWDITTNCLPKDIMNIFSSTNNIIPTGLKHGTLTIIGKDDLPYEITTYRLDGKYSDNRHPDKVKFTSNLKEDLSRRDFTINALAYNDEEGLIDYFNGISDLNNKIIRCVGNATNRFKEDALRMLRAIRFQAQLDFKIDADIYEALPKLSSNIKNISIERIREEFNKILLNNPFVISDLEHFNLLKHFIPEYELCKNTEQNNPYHIYNVADHTLCSACNIDKNLQLRLTMFLHDIGKPQCKTTDEFGVDHFYKHAEVSCKMAEIILKRMKYDNKTIEKVLILIKYHDLGIKSQNQMRRLLNKIGEDNLRELLKVQNADAKAKNLNFYDEKHNQLTIISHNIDNIIAENQCFSIKNLQVNGKDLIEIGISQGKQIGTILNELLEIVLDNPELNEKEKLLKLVKSQL